jgi:hypothetical protein
VRLKGSVAARTCGSRASRSEAQRQPHSRQRLGHQPGPVARLANKRMRFADFDCLAVAAGAAKLSPLAIPGRSALRQRPPWDVKKPAAGPGERVRRCTRRRSLERAKGGARRWVRGTATAVPGCMDTAVSASLPSFRHGCRNETGSDPPPADARSSSEAGARVACICALARRAYVAAVGDPSTDRRMRWRLPCAR